MDQLPDPFRAPEVLEPVPTQVGQGHALAQFVGDQRGRDVRQEHLAAVPARPQPRAADDGETEVVPLVAQLRFAGVQRHANVEGEPVGPLLRGQHPLRRDRRLERVRRPAERRHDAVALTLLDRTHAAV